MFLTLLPRGWGEQEGRAVSFEEKRCGRASPTAERSPSAREPRGAAARDDKHSRVSSLWLPADLLQHSVIFAYVACGASLAELSGGAPTCRGGWPLSLPSLPARWVSGCNFGFLFLRTNVHLPYAFVSAELQVPSTGEYLALRAALITSFLMP